ncbi:potassium channel family protein [Arcanobacterium bovis]|uniref:TrkA family potassium uptake protein n=1 Tax=Arcanobacterium bovis TaxID=2529275 RepID=A0A4Q9UZP4_9ACTO|nr:TrkA family potassium uptake protein [Arcanobacterium bovis]TBW21503.1 TrkA family potassium uptake protein [Arcanobacterium bovis]
MAHRALNEAVLVIGLGRFGSSIATTLDALGRDVLAVESDPVLVQKWSHHFPVIQADATSTEALEQLGARDFSFAVVAVGTSIEASVLITANLVDLGLEQVWAKAMSVAHGTILSRIGAHHVVYPEHDAGERVAHMVSGKMLDYIEIEDHFAVVKMFAPAQLQNRSLEELNLAQEYGINVIGIKAPNVPFQYATPQLSFGAGDVIIISGAADAVETFVNRF